MIVPQKIFESNEKFQLFIQNEKDWMYSRIVEAINVAFNTNNSQAYVMEAKIEDTMSIISINSHRDEWVSSLKLAMEWYITQEMYEKCKEIHDLIIKISAELL